MSNSIPFLSLRDVTAMYASEIHDAVLRVVDSGWYLQGKETERFEKEFATYTSRKYCVGCGNGLDALIWIFRAYKEMGQLQDGDEVLVPANTFIASVLAITENGLVPRLVEPDESTLEIDVDRIEENITPRTKALLLVHLYGRNAYNDRIGEICRRHGLKLVQDCAQSHGLHIASEEYSDVLENSACAYSFYPGKNLGALGDGGSVVTDDAALATTIRTLANYGSGEKYVFKYKGRNSRLDEIQATVLSVKLKHLDDDIRKRRSIATQYYDGISNRCVTLPTRLADKDNVYHLFPILIKGEGNRERMRQCLAEEGIGTVIHYPIPPHLQECYANEEWNTPRQSLPVAERLAAEELSLPMSPCMTAEEAERVIAIINRI